jgi:shikimate dehydrogenase
VRREGPVRARGAPGASTRVAAVIGDPIAHSLSPALHNGAYAALGLDWTFVAFTVAARDVAEVVRGARASGFGGLAVTMPDKDAAARAADQVSPTVERLGAANTIVFRSGVAIAESTDGEGLLADLAAAWGFRPEGARCAVLGAGGAARAAVLALADAGARQVVVVNRSRERAEAAAALAGPAGSVAPPEALAEVDLVVKATPLGMHAAGGANEAASLGRRLAPGQLALELVYDPPTTPFLEAARAAGATARNGLGMLVHQAARQFELFTGEEAPVRAMWEAIGGER